MIRCYIRLGRFERLLLPLVIGWLLLITPSSQAQITLNVTNFGAVGDAVQFFVNTTSNSVVVTTTNQLSSADIGKAIEVFGAGTQTSGIDSYGNSTNGNQDLIAYIANIVDATNLYVTVPASNTLLNTFATYGHDNTTNFNNCIAAAGTNAVINIPSGIYLFIPANHSFDPTAWWSIGLYRGGLTFNGAGTNQTILLGQGAWQLISGQVKRGIIFAEVPPITNNYPVVLRDMTLDGGVQFGNTPIHGAYPNKVDGQGWDGSHCAFVIRGFTGADITCMTWTNLVFQHWRGEIVKSNDGNTNGNLLIERCVFDDGEANAINVYPTLTVTNCLFNNIFQIVEYYQAYSTGACYFVNNIFTNITGNGVSINGGRGNNPPFFIQGNSFYYSTNNPGLNAIATTPGDNVYIISNLFYFGKNGICVAAGIPGYQSPNGSDSSNIVVRGNTFINPSIVLEVNGGALSYSDSKKTEAVEVYGNMLMQSNSGTPVWIVQCYTYATNIWLHDNDFITGVENRYVALSSGARNAPFALMDTNNDYYTQIYDMIGKTNYISYASGSRFEVSLPFHPGTVYALTDTNASQMPSGAQILIQNNTSNSNSIPVFLNSALTKGPVSVDYGQSLTAFWTNGLWAIHSSQPPIATDGLHVASLTNGP